MCITGVLTKTAPPWGQRPTFVSFGSVHAFASSEIVSTDLVHSLEVCARILGKIS